MPCENHSKSTEHDGNNACCCDKGIVHAHTEKTEVVIARCPGTGSQTIQCTVLAEQGPTLLKSWSSDRLCLQTATQPQRTEKNIDLLGLKPENGTAPTPMAETTARVVLTRGLSVGCVCVCVCVCVQGSFQKGGGSMEGVSGWVQPPLCDIPSGCCSFTGPWTVPPPQHPVVLSC